MVHAVIGDSYISQQEGDKQLCITESVVYTRRTRKAAKQIRKQVSGRQRKANEAESRKKSYQFYCLVND